MAIIRMCGTLGLIIALAGNAGAQTSHDDGHDVHAGPVMNYHRIDERLVTGGHLVDNGVEKLKAEGVKVVIDLRDNPPSDEKETYSEHGIEWINVPVAWRDPRPADFARFSEIMRTHGDEHVLVQCQANYRASAFTYLYRVVVSNVDEATAVADLHAIWNPTEDNKRWNQFIKDIRAGAYN